MLSTRLTACRAAFTAASRSTMAPLAAVRSYAQTQGQPQQTVKPPVALFGVDGTYASALYVAATKSSALEPTAKALENLAKTFKSDPKLSTVLSAPTLSATDKKALVAEVQKVSGGGEIIKNFLDTLAKNNRLGVLDGVCDKFAKLMSAHKGEVELVVTSASPLDNRTLRQLENAAMKSQYIKQGQRLKVVPKVNPDIRGGLVVEIGDRTIDLSVSAKMAKMNKLLRDQL